MTILLIFLLIGSIGFNFYYIFQIVPDFEKQVEKLQAEAWLLVQRKDAFKETCARRDVEILTLKKEMDRLVSNTISLEQKVHSYKNAYEALTEMLIVFDEKKEKKTKKVMKMKKAKKR